MPTLAEMIGRSLLKDFHNVGSRVEVDGVTLGPVNGTWQKLPMLSRAEFYALLDSFIKLLEKERNERTAAVHPGLNERALEAGRRGYQHMGFDEGERFVRVWKEDGQQGVCYFVEKDTGIIFGAKGWKAFNPNNEYGTLYTINEWAWGEYYAVSKNGLKALTPKWCRRK